MDIDNKYLAFKIDEVAMIYQLELKKDKKPSFIEDREKSAKSRSNSYHEYMKQFS